MWPIKQLHAGSLGFLIVGNSLWGVVFKRHKHMGIRHAVQIDNGFFC